MTQRSAYPGRLNHGIPPWVEPGASFHVRIRAKGDLAPRLTDPDLGRRLLESVVFYHRRRNWYVHLFLLMPDHLHAILRFPADRSMSRTVGSWKRYHTRLNGTRWQEGYFDHRLRNEEERVRKAHYIRMNPVAAGLCAGPEDWPWVVEPAREDQCTSEGHGAPSRHR
jgi:REP element-mobilizing transposase RayT